MKYIGNHVTVPKPEEPGSVLKLLKQDGVQIPHTRQLLNGNPCINNGEKKTFGIKEPPALVPDQVQGINTSALQTFNWRFSDDGVIAGKSMVDLRRIELDDIPPSPQINRPIHNDICQGSLQLSERFKRICGEPLPPETSGCCSSRGCRRQWRVP